MFNLDQGHSFVLMHLNRILWLKKWLLHKEGQGKTSAWYTESKTEVKPTHVNLGGGCLYIHEEEKTDSTLSILNML